jgi:hypothetical protein
MIPRIVDRGGADQWSIARGQRPSRVLGRRY